MKTYKRILLIAFVLAPRLLAAEPLGPLTDYLVLPKVGEYGKAPVHRDPIDALIASGAWQPPAAGEAVAATDGKSPVWTAVTTPTSGVLTDRRVAGGYAFATVESPEEQVVLLKATKHASVMVNGEWLAGDPYGYGFVELPILLREGANELLFHVARPGMRAELEAPEDDLSLLAADAVLPDLVRKEDAELWGAVPIVNASREPIVGAQVAAKVNDGEPAVFDLPRIEPLTVFKLKFRFTPPTDIQADDAELRVAVVRPVVASDVSANASDLGTVQTDDNLQQTPSPEASSGESDDLAAEDQEPSTPKTDLEILARVRMKLRVVDPGELTTRTFVSQIDGGVQRYAVLPANETANGDSTGTILSLHDFGVDCRDHASRHAAKPWAHVVAPQGRRRYGFDWEDWGADDALEALQDAARRYPANPRRTYLTGEGAGGHGAWLIGAMHADLFAAVAPQNSWLSYWSRGAGMPNYDDPTAVESMLVRAATGSNTLTVLKNLSPTGVYVLHDATSRLVSQSRFARRRLADFHPDFVYFERPNDPGRSEASEPSGMTSFLKSHESPRMKDVRRVDFITVDPGRSSQSAWATVEAQERALEPSRVQLELDAQARLFQGRTKNVALLSLDLSSLPGSVRVKLDSSPALRVERPAPRRGETGSRVWLAKNESGRWRQTPQPRRNAKTSQRASGFKSVFDHNALLVYGTNGTDQENHWARAKARYDAQTFWLRGGGSLEVVPDTEFNPLTNVNRNVVLYGNADTNRAWPALLSASPVQVRRSQVYVGVRPELGEDIGVLMVRPRRGSRTATVGVVGGSGIEGMRLTNRLRYFFSGIAYPDLTLVGPRALMDGSAGVRATGFFGADGSLDEGEVAWRDLAL